MSAATAAPAAARSRSCSHARAPAPPAAAADDDDDDDNNEEGEESEELKEAPPARVHSRPRWRQRIAGVLRRLLVILEKELEEDEDKE